MTPSAIHLNGIILGFPDGSRLFDRLSCTIAPGKTTCLLGPSGCGKSSLLRLISGTDEWLIEGSVRFDPDPSSAVHCAWMGQDDLLLPWFSLLDNVLLGPRLRNEDLAPLKIKASRLIAEAGLAGYEHALPGALSGGMRQRAALLRTLLEERPIMLMDEPFSALDALTRMRLQDVTSRLTKDATVLLVTHDVLEALRMAHRIIVLGRQPARIIADIEVGGEPPRRADSADISTHYGAVLDLLLGETP